MRRKATTPRLVRPELKENGELTVQTKKKVGMIAVDYVGSRVFYFYFFF